MDESFTSLSLSYWVQFRLGSSLIRGDLVPKPLIGQTWKQKWKGNRVYLDRSKTKVLLNIMCSSIGWVSFVKKSKFTLGLLVYHIVIILITNTNKLMCNEDWGVNARGKFISYYCSLIARRCNFRLKQLCTLYTY